MSRMMRVARLHKSGEPLHIDKVEVPAPGPKDVLVEVQACGIVPNMLNVAHLYREIFPHIVVPELPAVFGLDAAGVVVEKGSQAHGIEIGDRVYVNPGRHCGGCYQCRMGRFEQCPAFALAGYIGAPLAAPIFKDYPFGALGEFLPAPTYSLVDLPDNVSFDVGARFGYLGTGYRGLRLAEVGPGTTLLINGISGTLGLGVALLALAMGARKVLGTGRNRDLLERVRAIDPSRIDVHSTHDAENVCDWARRLTGGFGPAAVVDCLGPDAPTAAAAQVINAMARGGKYVTVGVVGEIPLELNQLMDSNRQVLGSCWFSTADAQHMADLMGIGHVDLSVFEHEAFKLDDINEALEGLSQRHGGFSNFVLHP